jgi:hypothetical protein
VNLERAKADRHDLPTVRQVSAQGPLAARDAEALRERIMPGRDQSLTEGRSRGH